MFELVLVIPLLALSPDSESATIVIVVLVVLLVVYLPFSVDGWTLWGVTSAGSFAIGALGADDDPLAAFGVVVACTAAAWLLVDKGLARALTPRNNHPGFQ